MSLTVGSEGKGPAPAWLWDQPVDIHFGSRTHVYLAVCDRGRNELYSVARLVAAAGGHGAVPEFDRQIAGVIGMENGRAGARRGHRRHIAIRAPIGTCIAIQAGIDRPHNSVGASLRRD